MVTPMVCREASDLARAFLRAFLRLRFEYKGVARWAGGALSAGGVSGDIASLSACLLVILR